MNKHVYSFPLFVSPKTPLRLAILLNFNISKVAYSCSGSENKGTQIRDVSFKRDIELPVAIHVRDVSGSLLPV